MHAIAAYAPDATSSTVLKPLSPALRLPGLGGGRAWTGLGDPHPCYKHCMHPHQMSAAEAGNVELSDAIPRSQMLPMLLDVRKSRFPDSLDPICGPHVL
jgi:hypothetical protein